MAQMVKLYFLRHGLADRSEWQGRDDDKRPLTEKGKRKMRLEAETFAALDLKLDSIITSPLVRAHQTAEIVANRLDMTVRVDDRIAPGFDLDDLQDILLENQGMDMLFVGHEPDFSLMVGALIGEGEIVFKKGSFARVDVYQVRPPQGALIWLLPPRILTLPR